MLQILSVKCLLTAIEVVLLQQNASETWACLDEEATYDL